MTAGVRASSTGFRASAAAVARSKCRRTRPSGSLGPRSRGPIYDRRAAADTWTITGRLWAR